MSTELFSCWKESLSFVRWSNFKLLFAATLNNAYRSAGIVIKYFWPLLLVSIAFFVYGLQRLNFFSRMVNILNNPQNTNKEAFFSFDTVFIFGLILFLYSSLCFLFQLAARPSLERKDLHYFLLYLPKSLALIPLLVISTCSNFMPFFLGTVTFFLFSAAPFFYLDAPSSIISFFTSIKRSIKFGVYFLPGIALCYILIIPIIMLILIIGALGVGVLSFLLKFFSVQIVTWTVFAFMGALFLAFSMILTAFSAILYTKIKHSNPSIFF